MDDGLISTDLTDELLYANDEADDPPITSDERLQEMDKEAKQREVDRLKKIPATEESTEEDVRSNDGYIISTKFVVCWKRRVEQGGWYRRARLVAVQGQHRPRTNIRSKIYACGSKIAQPPQRTAASQWFNLFARACKDFGLTQGVMQPTLFMKDVEIYITVHVDDVFMVGKETALKNFVKYLQEKMKWNVEEKGDRSRWVRDSTT